MISMKSALKNWQIKQKFERPFVSGVHFSFFLFIFPSSFIYIVLLLLLFSLLFFV